MRSNGLAKTKTLPATIFENYEPIKYYKDMENAHCQSENLDEYSIDHTAEVIIRIQNPGYYLSYQDGYYSM